MANPNGKWLAEYQSYLKVLVVGDGNFGFSCGLVESRQDGSKIVATSFQTYDDVKDMYKKEAEKHIEYLRKRGAKVLFGVDATTMAENHEELKNMRFDRIIFNFPHAGFDDIETDDGQRLSFSETRPQVRKKHQALVRDFFKNAAKMLTEEGEVHVTHKTAKPFAAWNLPELAKEAGLENFDTPTFDIKDYPGYKIKKGAGKNAGKQFKLKESSKFKFRKIK